MKYLFTFLAVIIYLQVNGQSCFPEGEQFFLQISLENQMAEHPDCTVFGGDLRLSTGIDDLSPLNKIEVIQGNLTISTSATSLEGLESLDSIIGNLLIESNNNLMDISALQNLKHVGGDFIIDNNSVLVNAGSFDNLSTIGGTVIEITDNEVMESLPQFPSLTEFNGHALFSELAMTDLSDLSNWEKFGQLSIIGNPNLTSSAGLSNLEAVTNQLNLSNNPSLSTIELPDIITIGSISFGNDITSIVANQLETLGGNIELSQYHQLTAFDFPSLQSYNGNLKINNTVNLTQIKLPVLKKVDGDLDIFYPDNLIVFEAPSVDSIMGKFHIIRADITQLVMPNLKFAQDISIKDNNSVYIDFDLTDLSVVTESFRIDNCTIPENLILNNLVSVGNVFSIQECPGLVNVESSIETAGPIDFDDNPELKDLIFPMLTTHGYFRVFDNFELETINFQNVTSSGYISIEGEKIETIDLGNLTTSDGGIWLRRMYQLSLLDISSIQNIDGSFNLISAHNLGDLNFPILDTVGGEFIVNGDSITSIFAPSLNFVKEDFSYSSKELTQVNMNSLEEIGGRLTIGGGNTILQEINIPSLLRCGSVTLGGLPTLKHVSIPYLDWVEYSFNFENLSTLETVDFSSLRVVNSQTNIEQIDFEMLSFPSLDSVGWFILRNCERMKEIRLDELSFVQYRFNIQDNDSIIAIEFPSLKIASEDFEFVSNELLETISVPSLEKVGEWFYLSWNPSLTSVNVPVLDSVETINVQDNNGYQNLMLDDIKNAEHLYVARNDQLTSCSFKNLNVESSIGFNDNEMLVTVDLSNEIEISGDFVFNRHGNLSSINIENLEKVGGEFVLTFNGGPIDINPQKIVELGAIDIKNNSGIIDLNFDALQIVENTIEVENNDSLTNIIWPFLKTTGDKLDVEKNDNLLNLDNSSLETVGSDLKISDNIILKNLVCPKLSFVNGDLSVFGNFDLEQLEMIALTEINGAIHIQEHNKLTSLEGIANIDPASIMEGFSGYEVLLTNNPMLSFCSVESICGVIADPDKEVRFFNNAEGCESKEELDCDAFKFGGHVFFDANNNGIRDPGENGVPNFPIQIEQNEKFTFPKANGKYSFFGDDGATYTISLDLDESWEFTTEEAYTFDFEEGSFGFNDFDFGIQYFGQVYDGKTNITSEATRCNTDVDFVVSYQHLGGGYEGTDDVFLQITFDPQSSLVVSSTPFESFDQNVGIIKLNDLSSFDRIDIDMLVTMPDEMSTGEVIYFDIEAYMPDPQYPTEFITLDKYTYEALVLCSYDPNDKLVSPIGVQDENYTLWDETLTYTIRFQNTGNAEALTVEILDTIDQSLDMRTFNVLSSSHDVLTTVSDRYVSFLFEGINLPDSTSNEQESHGYVTYEILPKEDISDLTIVTNTAHIIFDFNPPIVTNTIKNTLVEMIPTVNSIEVPKSTLVVKPNPATTVFTIEIDQFEFVELFDVTGRKLLTSYDNRVDISDLNDKFYIARVMTKDGALVVKIAVAR